MKIHRSIIFFLGSVVSLDGLTLEEAKQYLVVYSIENSVGTTRRARGRMKQNIARQLYDGITEKDVADLYDIERAKHPYDVDEQTPFQTYLSYDEVETIVRYFVTKYTASWYQASNFLYDWWQQHCPLHTAIGPALYDEFKRELEQKLQKSDLEKQQSEAAPIERSQGSRRRRTRKPRPSALRGELPLENLEFDEKRAISE